MRRLLFATLVAIAISSNVGCIIPIYDADPAEPCSPINLFFGGFPSHER